MVLNLKLLLCKLHPLFSYETSPALRATSPIMGRLGGLVTCKPLQDGAYELRIAAFFLQEAVFASVDHVDDEAQDGPACEQHQRMRRQFGEDESAADEAGSLSTNVPTRSSSNRSVLS